MLSNALRGRDILGNAPTGSGKTLAYLLPYLALLSHPATVRTTPGQGPSGIIIVPTRELVEQVYALCMSIIPPYTAQYQRWLEYYAQCAVQAGQYTPPYTHQSLMGRRVLGLVGGTCLYLVVAPSDMIRRYLRAISNRSAARWRGSADCHAWSVVAVD